MAFASNAPSAPALRALPAPRRVGACLAALALALGLAGCSFLPASMGGPPAPPKPAELAPNPNLLGVRQAWTAKLGAVGFPLAVQVNGTVATVAATDGSVASIDTQTGAIRWRASAGAPLTAGVGGDGEVAAVVTRDSELVVLSRDRTLWRQRLGVQVHTPPLLAGGRVFVLAADRSISAFDAANGARLWTQQRSGDALVLRQAGVLLPVGNTLVVGQGGRMAGLNPDNGSVRWEAAIASSRGTNDVERLVDLVGRVSRVGDSLCARAFQVAVGCVDASRGAVTWTKTSAGAEGLHGDERQVFGTESDGRVVAWRRADGERLWSIDSLRFRGLTTPILLGRSVAIGDAAGYVHLLSREDGSLLNRLTTDGSGIAAAPVLAGNTLVVVTRSGGIFGFVPL